MSIQPSPQQASSPGLQTGIVGATGLTGSFILSSLLTHPSVSIVTSYTRRSIETPDPHSRLRPVVDSNHSTWSSSFVKGPALFFSALGTTRANAGGLENQRKIDTDLGLEIAQAAKNNGVKVFVVISVAGANKDSMFPYTRMKGDLEEGLKKLKFDEVVFIRPGMICGKRREGDGGRPGEAAFVTLANIMGKLSGGWLKDFWAQDADLIGTAAVAAGLQALEKGGEPGRVRIIGGSEIVKIARGASKSQ